VFYFIVWYLIKVYTLFPSFCYLISKHAEWIVMKFGVGWSTSEQSLALIIHFRFCNKRFDKHWWHFHSLVRCGTLTCLTLFQLPPQISHSIHANSTSLIVEEVWLSQYSRNVKVFDPSTYSSFSYETMNQVRLYREWRHDDSGMHWKECIKATWKGH